MQIEAGQFTSRRSGESFSGVLVRDGKKEIALVTWADNDFRRQSALYRRVKAALDTGGGIAALQADPAVRVREES